MRNRKETGRAKEQEKPTEPATTGHTKEAENDKKDETSTSSSSSSEEETELSIRQQFGPTSPRAKLALVAAFCCGIMIAFALLITWGHHIRPGSSFLWGLSGISVMFTGIILYVTSFDETVPIAKTKTSPLGKAAALGAGLFFGIGLLFLAHFALCAFHITWVAENCPNPDSKTDIKLDHKPYNSICFPLLYYHQMFGYKTPEPAKPHKKQTPLEQLQDRADEFKKKMHL